MVDDMRECLRRLKIHKAAGCDGVPAELLKYLGGTGVCMLSHLVIAIFAT